MTIETAVLHKPELRHMYFVKFFFCVFFAMLAKYLISQFNGESGMEMEDMVWVSFWIALIATVFFAMIFPLISTTITNGIETKTRKALEEYIGEKPDYLNTSFSMHNKNDVSISGSAIAVHKDIIYIVDHGVVAKIGWDDIRKWGWKTAGYEIFSGVGFSGTLNAKNATGNAKAIAYMDSGFFIEVKDVDKPSWQFMCDDKNVLKRWNEILTQMDERLPAA